MQVEVNWQISPFYYRSTILIFQNNLNTGYYNKLLPLTNSAPPSHLFSFSQLCLIFVLLVQHENIFLGDPGPALAVNVVQVDLPSTVGITVRGLVDGAAAQLAGLLHGQVVPQATVHDTVGVHGARAHRK